MATTYLQDTNRGRVLHLIRMTENQLGGESGVYLDASVKIKDALWADNKAGYKNGGPRMAIEVQRACEYAEYVAQHATSENLHSFNCAGYFFFTEKSRAASDAKHA